MNCGAGLIVRAAPRWSFSTDRSCTCSMARSDAVTGFSSINDTRCARPARRRSTSPSRSRCSTTLAARSRLYVGPTGQLTDRARPVDADQGADDPTLDSGNDGFDVDERCHSDLSCRLYPTYVRNIRHNLSPPPCRERSAPAGSIGLRSPPSLRRPAFPALRRRSAQTVDEPSSRSVGGTRPTGPMLSDRQSTAMQRQWGERSLPEPLIKIESPLGLTEVREGPLPERRSSWRPLTPTRPLRRGRDRGRRLRGLMRCRVRGCG